jgi:hypothetical protein
MKITLFVAWATSAIILIGALAGSSRAGAPGCSSALRSKTRPRWGAPGSTAGNLAH